MAKKKTCKTKKVGLTKKDYVLAKINELLVEKYKNEIAMEYQELLDTEESRKQIESAKVNIATVNKQIEWLEVILEKL